MTDRIRWSWAPLAAGLAALAVTASLIAYDLNINPAGQMPASITQNAGHARPA